MQQFLNYQWDGKLKEIEEKNWCFNFCMITNIMLASQIKIKWWKWLDGRISPHVSFYISIDIRSVWEIVCCILDSAKPTKAKWHRTLHVHFGWDVYSVHYSIADKICKIKIRTIYKPTDSQCCPLNPDTAL